MAKKTIDLRHLKCPVNLVKTKLELEKMEKRDILEVYLSDPIIARDLLKSLAMDGYEIVNICDIEHYEDATFLLTVRRRSQSVFIRYQKPCSMI